MTGLIEKIRNYDLFQEPQLKPKPKGDGVPYTLISYLVLVATATIFSGALAWYRLHRECSVIIVASALETDGTNITWCEGTLTGSLTARPKYKQDYALIEEITFVFNPTLLRPPTEAACRKTLVTNQTFAWDVMTLACLNRPYYRSGSATLRTTCEASIELSGLRNVEWHSWDDFTISDATIRQVVHRLSSFPVAIASFPILMLPVRALIRILGGAML